MSETQQLHTAFPLSWPAGKPRAKSRKGGQFRTTFGAARDGLLQEVRRLGGTAIVLSTNIPLRLDGLPYANAKLASNDPGVACYFTRNKKQFAFACDAYYSVDDNVHAIGKTIEALRGISRWGTGDMMEAAFTGFLALPGPGQSSGDSWWSVLGVPESAHCDTVKAAWKELVRKHHPDTGGDRVQFERVAKAWEQFNALGRE